MFLVPNIHSKKRENAHLYTDTCQSYLTMDWQVSAMGFFSRKKHVQLTLNNLRGNLSESIFYSGTFKIVMNVPIAVTNFDEMLTLKNLVSIIINFPPSFLSL